MKKLETNELAQKTIKELVQLRKTQKKSLQEMRTKLSLRGLKQTHLVRINRRNIARINTFLHSKINE